MEQSPSWEADSHSATQETPVNTFPPYFPKILSYIILPMPLK